MPFFRPFLCIAAFRTDSISEQLRLFQSTLKQVQDERRSFSDSSCVSGPCFVCHILEILGKLRILHSVYEICKFCKKNPLFQEIIRKLHCAVAEEKDKKCVVPIIAHPMC